MTGHNAAIGGGGFHHVALYVKDFDASMRFYKDALGFTEKAAWPSGTGMRVVLLDTGDGNYFEVIESDAAKGMPERSTLHIALRSDDADAAIERARAAGAKITLEPKGVEFKSNPPIKARIGFCEGPDGESIEFFQNTLT